MKVATGRPGLAIEQTEGGGGSSIRVSPRTPAADRRQVRHRRDAAARAHAPGRGPGGGRRAQRRRRDAQVRGVRAEGARRRDREDGPARPAARRRLQPRPAVGRGGALGGAPGRRLGVAVVEPRAAPRLLGPLVRADSGAGKVRHGRRAGRPSRRRRAASCWRRTSSRGPASKAGTTLYRVGNLGRVWVQSAVAERDAGFVSVGQPARVRLQHRLRSARRRGSRSSRRPSTRRPEPSARGWSSPTRGWRSSRGCSPTWSIDAPLGVRLAVPDSALLLSGEHRYVFVDRGGGRLEPVEVAGRRARRRLRRGSTAGSRPGDRVATGATFLLSSEAKLRDALPRWRVAVIARLIALSARHRLIVLLLVALGAGAGVWSLRRTPLDAVPDLSDVQVTVYTEWMGRSPDLVEDQITYPIVTALVGAPRVTAVRGQSMFGMSFVNVIFEDGTDLYWARSRVLEYMSSLAAKLPDRVTPVLGPDATGVGWVYEYALVDRRGRHEPRRSCSRSRTGPCATRCRASPAWRRWPARGASPRSIRSTSIPIVCRASASRSCRSPRRSGARTTTSAAACWRSPAPSTSSAGAATSRPPPTSRRSCSAARTARPSPCATWAQVRIGPAQRRGLARSRRRGRDRRRGGDHAPGRERPRRHRRASRRGSPRSSRRCPHGVEVVTTYDRSTLIRDSIGTLRRTLIEEMVVVGLVILVFLLHVRSTLVPVLMLPIAVLLAFVPDGGHAPRRQHHEPGRDRHRHRRDGRRRDHRGRERPQAARALGDRGPPRTRAARWSREALTEVGRPIFFSLLVITVAFLPVFTLEGTEGRLFKPLAYTKTFSMAFAALLSVTLVPAIAALFIRGRIRSRGGEPDRPAARRCLRAGLPVRAPVPLADPGRRGAAGRGDDPGRAAPRQRVHAAAQRRDAALHADRRARHERGQRRRRPPAHGPRA